MHSLDALRNGWQAQFTSRHCKGVCIAAALHSLRSYTVLLVFVSSPTVGCCAWHSVINMPPLPLHRSAGHSLGGALAVLAAWDLAQLFPWASLKVYTVGAPRPGNHAFAKVTAHLPRQQPWQSSLGHCLCKPTQA